MSIEVKKVSKYYGEQAALKEVSLSIKKGDIVGFLGPNGAGKSTLMKIICCYLSKDEGQLSVCNQDIEENAIEIKSKIGYLPEHNPLYAEMYIKEYLAFVAGIYKLSKNRIDEMISITGLEKEQHKKISQLSKGYRQRVGLAAALIHDPEVLILDEPTTGLDPNQLVEIRNLIKESGKNKTVLLSTHIMQEVDRICNRVIIINKGQIVADKKLEELRANNIDLENYFQELTQ
jgi:ABC-2 type transport system ATP-binding protein